MKEAIFKSSEHQQQLDEKGFVKIKLFEDSTISELKKLLRQYHPEADQLNYFNSSTYLGDFSLKKEISERITDVIKKEANRVFKDFRVLGGSFLLKGKGQHSEMPLHQDWTIVDEDQFYALNMWIPLVATNDENGTIEVLPGSHRFNEALRAPSLPFYFAGHEHTIIENMHSVPAQPGEVVILNQALIHYSKPNKTEKIRPAITCGILSKDAPLYFHYWDGKSIGKLEKFRQKDDFLLAFEDFHKDIYDRPKTGESIGFVEYTPPSFDEDLLLELINSEPKKQTKKSYLFGLIKR